MLEFLMSVVIAATGEPSGSTHPFVIEGPQFVVPGTGRHQCVPAELAEHVRRESDANRRRLGLQGHNDGGGIAGPSPFPMFDFYPLAANCDRETIHGNYVDLDPTAGFSNYACLPFTYNGHAGIDTGLRSFTEQSIGVPVFAAADGTVVFAQDGWPDMNINGGIQGNIIAIDHGSNVTTEYYHLKNGSVAVTVGQVVKAGKQIGMAASSGNSFGPHLHFGVVHNGQVFETFAGPCRPGPSGWTNQPAEDTNVRVYDFGITKQDLNTLPQGWWLPYELPAEGQIALNEPALRFWWKSFNFPPNCPIHIQISRPNNSVAVDWAFNWSNPDEFRSFSNWFGWDFQAMGPVTGTWHLLFELDNQVMFNAPFEVVNTVNPNFNRAPVSVTASFDPPNPNVGDVVFCRVNSPLALDDLDFDTVRYHYVWKVNGAIVRDVTTAGLADAIPHHTACGDSLLQCTVTPGDGVANGTPAIVNVLVSGPHTADITCNGVVNVEDLLAVIGSWGPCPAPCAADINIDGMVNVVDLLAVISGWGS